MYEENLIRYCAPTLAGIKTGNMFTCSYKSKEEVCKNIRNLNKTLVPKGLTVMPLRYSKDRALIYVYRPNCLKRDFENEGACALLEEFGYPYRNPEKCVIRLMEILKNSHSFPHEIGLFLGYPPEDVKGFIENRAAKCKKCGFWKVYHDEERAERLFNLYEKCSYTYRCQWLEGASIEKLAVHL